MYRVLQDLIVEATQSLLSSYKNVQSMADTVLKRAVKQYPCLVQPLVPFLLSALAGLPLPGREALRASLDGADAPHGQELQVDVGFVRQLCEKASQAVGSEAATAEVSAAGEKLSSDICPKKCARFSERYCAQVFEILHTVAAFVCFKKHQHVYPGVLAVWCDTLVIILSEHNYNIL